MTESYIKAVFRTGQRIRFRRDPSLPEGGSPECDGIGRLARAVPHTNGRTVTGYLVDLRCFDDGRCDKSADLYFPHQVFIEEGPDDEGGDS